MRNTKCKQTKLIGSAILQHFRDLFWDRNHLLAAEGLVFLELVVNRWIREQQCAIARPEQLCESENSGVHGWISHGFCYVGFLRRARMRQAKSSGMLFRWGEHMIANMKPLSLSSDVWRFRLARKHKTGLSTFVALS